MWSLHYQDLMTAEHCVKRNALSLSQWERTWRQQDVETSSFLMEVEHSLNWVFETRRWSLGVWEDLLESAYALWQSKMSLLKMGSALCSVLCQPVGEQLKQTAEKVCELFASFSVLRVKPKTLYLRRKKLKILLSILSLGKQALPLVLGKALFKRWSWCFLGYVICKQGAGDPASRNRDSESPDEHA